MGTALQRGRRHSSSGCPGTLPRPGARFNACAHAGTGSAGARARSAERVDCPTREKSDEDAFNCDVGAAWHHVFCFVHSDRRLRRLGPGDPRRPDGDHSRHRYADPWQHRRRHYGDPRRHPHRAALFPGPIPLAHGVWRHGRAEATNSDSRKPAPDRFGKNEMDYRNQGRRRHAGNDGQFEIAARGQRGEAGYWRDLRSEAGRASAYGDVTRGQDAGELQRWRRSYRREH